MLAYSKCPTKRDCGCCCYCHCWLILGYPGPELYQPTGIPGTSSHNSPLLPYNPLWEQRTDRELPTPAQALLFREMSSNPPPLLPAPHRTADPVAVFPPPPPIAGQGSAALGPHLRTSRKGGHERMGLVHSLPSFPVWVLTNALVSLKSNSRVLSSPICQSGHPTPLRAHKGPVWLSCWNGPTPAV